MKSSKGRHVSKTNGGNGKLNKPSLFDGAYQSFPPRAVMKQMVGMVITNVLREKESDGDNTTEKISIEVDGFAMINVEIRSMNGVQLEVRVETVPTGKKRLSDEEKIRLILQ